MKRIVFPVLFAAVILIAQGCEKYVVVIESNFDTYTTSVQPIFTSSCALSNCHNGSVDPNLTDGSSYVALTSGNYVDIQDPEESVLIKQLKGGHGYISQSDIETLLAWIQAGAPND